MFALTAWDKVIGEKGAMVGGFGSAIEIGAPSSSLRGFGEGDIESSQGVSWRRGQLWFGGFVAHAKQTYYGSHLQRHGWQGTEVGYAILSPGVGVAFTKDKVFLVQPRQ